MNKEHIPFIPLKEDFNEYRVENGQLLKVKTVLTDVAVETLEPGKKTSRLGVKDFSIIITDVDIDVSKMEYATPEQISDVDVVGELRFTTVKESVNIYEIQKLLILIATRVDKIFMTNKKDLTNNPIIRYTSHTGLSSVDKEMLYTQQTSPLT
jgi:DNA polymerase III alpha subunit (gram-positive type)